MSKQIWKKAAQCTSYLGPQINPTKKLLTMDLFDYSMAKKGKSVEKPVLLAIFHGVYSAIPDKKRAIQNLVCLFIVGTMLFSMNSNSWYIVSNHEERGDEEQGFELRIGLSEIEQFDYETEEDGTTDISTVIVSISECVDERPDDGPCSDFEPQGIIMLVILWVSLISLLLVLVASTYSGLKPVSGDFWDKKIIDYRKWIFRGSSLLLLAGSITYAIISKIRLDTDDIPDDLDFGFGITWWLMLIVSIAYCAFVYFEQIKSLIKKTRNNQSEQSN